ncbi:MULTISPECIES: hypothetical protein [Moorena]|uniref:hypothetical protein n=1 Tax=Moorena TaxID=1155738 RepID=UPI00105524E4|nr:MULTISPECIES: hypothetical protein [Moorena]NEP34007.1 hypothetical protein [Moorena sp. SIO3B2]NEQ15825.1 hypothetical protein [Moorena sp. SIO3E2]
MAKRPRVRVQPSTLQPWPKGHACAFNLQPWPKGHACAFNLQRFNLQSSTLAKRPRVRVQPSTFNLQPLNLQLR